MIIIIIDFINDNWAAFIQHCKSHGIESEVEIEKELEELKKKRRK